jgi:hypothetical protein
MIIHQIIELIGAMHWNGVTTSRTIFLPFPRVHTVNNPFTFAG